MQELSSSFRDPDGFVFEAHNRLFRCVLPHAAAGVRMFLQSPLAASLISRGSMVATSEPNQAGDTAIPEPWRDRISPGSLLLEHSVIAFRNYPYEWPPAMLHAAAALTLDLAISATRAGFVLKDATPYNVMFRGPHPVFLDVLSFRQRDPLSPVWQPYGQFIRTFIYPLLACRNFGLELNEILLAHRDGLEADRLLALCPVYRRFLPPLLTSVTLPALLGRRERNDPPRRYRERRARDPKEASFILERLFLRAKKLLESATPRPGKASSYVEACPSYSAGEALAKRRIVDQALDSCRPSRVIDLGCNTGSFSLLAAEKGASVAAIDRDPNAVDALWRAAVHEKREVLPLVVDIGWPPGARGWGNAECAAFLDRARGAFDCVLMLALIHHLLVNERVPLPAILQLAADLTTQWAIVEYIDPQDALFQRIVRGREALHESVTPANFESAAAAVFQLIESHEVSPTRRIYILRKRPN